MWSMYVEYSSSAVGHIYAMWQAYLSGAYVSNAKCMFTSACGDIVDCTEFILGVYTDTFVSCAHELIGIYI